MGIISTIVTVFLILSETAALCSDCQICRRPFPIDYLLYGNNKWKTSTENEMCVFLFSAALVRNTFCSDKCLEIYTRVTLKVCAVRRLLVEPDVGITARF
jgi:hypothetical protein